MEKEEEEEVMSEESKKEETLDLVQIESEEDPSGYHLAKITGGCPDSEQTFCGLPLVEVLRGGMRMIPIKVVRFSLPRPMRRKRGLCCRGCWRGVPTLHPASEIYIVIMEGLN